MALALDVPDVTICCLCRKTFTEPRILPCVQTFCLGCLQENSSRFHRRPGDKMPCPVCQKEFTIPQLGLADLVKDFFMERLIRMKAMVGSNTGFVQCALCCEADTTMISLASNFCIECSDNLCDTCAVHHKRQRASREHQVVESARLSDLKSLKAVTPRTCELHPTKPIELYCTDCRLVSCVTCFVDMHQGHKCSSVQVLEDFYRKKTAGNASKVAWYESMVRTMNEQLQIQEKELKIDFKEKERLIVEKSLALKLMIDQHTSALLGTLSAAKRKQSEKIETDRKHLGRLLQTLAVFKAYCGEIASKGSAEEVCRLEDVVQKRSDDFWKDIRIPRLTFQTALYLTGTENTLFSSGSNIVGTISVRRCEAIVQPQSSLLVVGLEVCPSITNEVIRINLDREWHVTPMPDIPAKVRQEAAGIANYGTLFITGIGENWNDIWKYDSTSFAWAICGSLGQGRRRHCVAIVDQTLYICGGSLDGIGVLNSIEAYNTLSKPASCQTVGCLTYGVDCAACVGYGDSVYIFGGCDKDFQETNYVQVYSTCLQTCSVLPLRMHVQLSHLRAVLWDKYAILMSESTCLLFNFETGNWQMRERFKTDVSNFGLTLVGDRIFAVGGETWLTDGNERWNRTDDVRYVPVENFILDKPIKWKIHAKLPRPCAVHTCVHMVLLQA